MEWKIVKEKTYKDGRPGMALEIGGRKMKSGEFFRYEGSVYQYSYISTEQRRGYDNKKLPGEFEYGMVADKFNSSRVLVTDGYGNKMGCWRLYQTSGEGMEYIPDYKPRDLKAEAAEKVWKKFPASVHAKYLAQAAPCDTKEDGSPNFGMIGVMGPEDLEDQLKSMRADFYGEHITHSKFGVDGRESFKTEEDAVEAFWEDPRAWHIHKWDGKQWLTATMKKGAKGAREVKWVAES